MKIFKKIRILRVHIRGDKKGKYCKKLIIVIVMIFTKFANTFANICKIFHQAKQSNYLQRALEQTNHHTTSSGFFYNTRAGPARTHPRGVGGTPGGGWSRGTQK